MVPRLQLSQNVHWNDQCDVFSDMGLSILYTLCFCYLKKFNYAGFAWHSCGKLKHKTLKFAPPWVNSWAKPQVLFLLYACDAYEFIWARSQTQPITNTQDHPFLSIFLSFFSFKRKLTKFQHQEKTKLKESPFLSKSSLFKLDTWAPVMACQQIGSTHLKGNIYWWCCVESGIEQNSEDKQQAVILRKAVWPCECNECCGNGQED